MASNSFGQALRMTTFGESHGPCIGVVVDGFPSNISLDEKMINQELANRRPGKSPYTSLRKEMDCAEIVSGVFEGKTTGAPIAILIKNQDAKSSEYDGLKELYRPGHANFTYLHKYGIFDHRGGGRASARETAARVAAGAIAKQLLKIHAIECISFISEIGGIAIEEIDISNALDLKSQTYQSPIFCPDVQIEGKMRAKLEEVREDNDSLGGVVSCVIHGAPIGLGDPVYAKLEALLGFAMLSIPASKGFEIGQGFHSARMRGSEHNDPFDLDERGEITCKSNFAGGVLGGISTGAPIFFKVAFKPTSSIKKEQTTVSLDGKAQKFCLAQTARHDPCVAIRAVPVVEAMASFVLADALLMQSQKSYSRSTFV